VRIWLVQLVLIVIVIVSVARLPRGGRSAIGLLLVALLTALLTQTGRNHHRRGRRR